MRSLIPKRKNPAAGRYQAIFRVCRLDMSDLEYSTQWKHSDKERILPMNSLQPRSPSPHRRRTQKAISGQVAGGIRKTTPMKTIAISRLIGSEAAKIAQRVTEALGYTMVNKNVLEAIFRQYGLEKFGELYTSPPNVWDLANARNLLIVSMLNDTMEALAHRGDMLILGRGGYASLSKYADVLNVRLQAPFSVRVERVMARENIPNRLRAEQRVKADDTARQKFVSRFYNQEWDNASEPRPGY